VKGQHGRVLAIGRCILLRRENSGAQGGRVQGSGVEAPPVVAYPQFEVAVFELCGANGYAAPWGFVLLPAGRGRLDRVVDAVSYNVYHRRAERFEDSPVHLDLFAFHGDFDVLALIPGEVAHQLGQPFEQGSHGQHQGLLEFRQQALQHGGKGPLVAIGLPRGGGKPVDNRRAGNFVGRVPRGCFANPLPHEAAQLGQIGGALHGGQLDAGEFFAAQQNCVHPRGWNADGVRTGESSDRFDAGWSGLGGFGGLRRDGRGGRGWCFPLGGLRFRFRIQGDVQIAEGIAGVVAAGAIDGIDGRHRPLERVDGTVEGVKDLR